MAASSQLRTVSELEATYRDKSIVLVSHADTLQIAQTYLCSHGNNGCDSRQFHRYRFKNGEVIIVPTSDYIC